MAKRIDVLFGVKTFEVHPLKEHLFRPGLRSSESEEGDSMWPSPNYFGHLLSSVLRELLTVESGRAVQSTSDCRVWQYAPGRSFSTAAILTVPRYPVLTVWSCIRRTVAAAWRTTWLWSGCPALSPSPRQFARSVFTRAPPPTPSRAVVATESVWSPGGRLHASLLLVRIFCIAC